MVDYINAQYSLLESGHVQSLETYQDAMDRSAEAAVRDQYYMSLVVEEYVDGGTVSYASAFEPMPLYPPVGPDGIVMGSDADMAWEPWDQSDPVDPVASGPVFSRMAPHLIP
jgi:hypothetical protein